MAKAAVSRVDAHGASVLRRRDQKTRRKTVLGKLGECSRGAGQRLQGSVEHVENQEADDGRLGEAPENGRQRRRENVAEIAAQRLRPQRAQPDDRERHEIERRHKRADQHGARHVALRVERLADVAGRRLEGRSAEADEVETRHRRGQGAEPTGKRHGQMKIDAAMPIDLAAQHRGERGHESQQSGHYGDRDASIAVQRTPHRLTAVNASTIKQAIAGTGTAGRHQALMATADMMAVTPQVGTQPHQ